MLQKDWRNMLTSFTTLVITIDHGVPFHSVSLYDHIFISFHSPNILPDLIIPGENYNELYLGRDYILGLSYIKIEHLEGYDAGCINYDLDYKHANNNIRSDCMLNCMRDLTKCKKGSEPPDSLLRREYFERNLDQKPNKFKINRTLLDKYHKQCQIKCPIQCKFTYYDLEMDVSDEKDENYTKTTIILKHNLLPDYIVKHVPEISLVTFCRNYQSVVGLQYNECGTRHAWINHQIHNVEMYI